MHIDRVWSLVTSAPGVALALASIAAPVIAQTPPNLLIVLADDLGPETLGCYQMPAGAIATPAFDSLAANGVRFDRAYANPMCSPSRACLQTGRYAFRTGVTFTLGPGPVLGDPGLRDEETLLPEALPGSYQTAMIGKWHLGYRHGLTTPNVEGWGHFAGCLDLGLYSYTLWFKIVDGRWSICTNYATSENVDDALSWIQSQQGPWALMLCFNAPHVPYEAPPANLHSFNLEGIPWLTQPLPYYQAMVQAMDTELGRLLEGIGPALANTNIIVASDNGEPGYLIQQLSPQSHGKGTLFEGGVRIPLLVSGPCVVHPGRTCSELVSMVDLFATAVDLCGGTQPPGIDGVSIVPLLQDQPGPVRPSAFDELVDGYSLTHRDYKLIRITASLGRTPHDELYDLDTDPFELSDLLQAPSPTVLAIQQSMSDELRVIQGVGWATSYGTPCPGTYGVPAILAEQPPHMGSDYIASVDYDSPDLAMVTIGFSDQQMGSMPLPIDLSVYGMPGCDVLSDALAVQYFGPTMTNFSLHVPWLPSLLWGTFFLQGFAIDPLANAGGFVATAGLRLVIGN
jgi:arylsulfatase A-like enzyme